MTHINGIGNCKRYGSETTALTLTDKAFEEYSGTDPLDIFEKVVDYDENDNPIHRYYMRGAYHYNGLTADEVNEILEAITDEANEIIAREALNDDEGDD